MRKNHHRYAAIVLGLPLASATLAADVEIGTATRHGLAIAAVYIQPVLMEPSHPGMQPADIHLEADIAATADNPHGFAAESWVPYLTVSYVISKQGSDWQHVGTLMPMIASDGPHYADNLQLDGAGKYRLRYRIEAPARAGFHRHTDRETGVPPWWKPIELDWAFVFAGSGKKGGY